MVTPISFKSGYMYVLRLKILWMHQPLQNNIQLGIWNDSELFRLVIHMFRKNMWNISNLDTINYKKYWQFVSMS